MAIKIKIDNRTQWDTTDLRVFILAGLKAKGWDGSVTVVVRSAKQSYGSSGRAYVNSRWFQLNLPAHGGFDPDKLRAEMGIYKQRVAEWDAGGQRGQKPRVNRQRAKILWDVLPEKFLVDAAQVLEHEVDHCLGLRHEDMMRCRDIKVPWVEGLQIRRKGFRPKPAPKPRPSAAEKREAGVRTKLVEWETKLKRAQRKVKEYRKKARYYDRKLEKAAAQAPKGGNGGSKT